MAGGARTVTFVSDLSGQVIRRDESDAHTTGDPHEHWYRFAGKQLGYVGNNGTSDLHYKASANERIVGGGAGAYRNGSTSTIAHADFDQSLTPINSFYQGSAGGGYRVRAGDTLGSIAANLWGDSALWYKIAEVNGLSAGATLVEGQSLTLPTGAMKSTHSASTFSPYDPTEVLGSTSPTAPKPQKENKCGGFGMVLLVVIAIAVTVITRMPIIKMLSGLGVSASTAIVAGSAMAGAAGSIASQGVGVATGIQDKFSWNAVALAAIGGGVGGAMGGGAPAATWQQAAWQGVQQNVVTQGIALATGLQSKFDWAGLATAGVGAAVAHSVLPSVELAKMKIAHGATSGAYIGASLGRGMASALANAAARSLIEGSDFGDNVMAALPDVIGQTIGEAIGGGIAGRTPHGSIAAAEAELPSGLPFAVDKSRVDAAAVKARLGDYQYGMLDLVETANGYSITTSGAYFDASGSLYHPEGATQTLFEYAMDSKRPLAAIWLALPESRQVVHLIMDENGMHVYGGSGDARIADLGLSIRASGVSEDIVVTGSRRGGDTDWRERAARNERNSAALLSAVGWGYREAAVGVYQGAVQGGYDLAIMGLDSQVAIVMPHMRGRTFDALAHDFFGEPTRNWQGAGRVVGQIGLPLPGNGVRILANGALRLTRVTSHADDLAASISTGSSQLRAIAAGAADLSPRQASVLVQLEGFNSRTIITKSGFGQNDLAALSAATGDEFAMFTTGGRRLIIRGDATGVPIGIADGSAHELAAQGWRFSSHVHPDGSLLSSAGDRAVLSVFGNSRSAVLSPTGSRGLFSANGDMIGPGWLPGRY